MQKPISLHTKKRNLSHSDCESVSCYDPAATLEMKKRLMFLSISLENLPCCIPHSPTPPPLTGLIHAHLHSNSLHQKISKETTTSVRRDLLRRFKKHSWWIFNKTGYLVQVGVFFFNIPNYVRVWYVFKEVSRQLCLAPAQKNKTRSLLLLLSVTVRTFSIQNQGQHCALWSHERATTVDCFLFFIHFLKIENAVLCESAFTSRACMSSVSNRNSERSLKRKSDSVRFSGRRIRFLYGNSRPALIKVSRTSWIQSGTR